MKQFLGILQKLCLDFVKFLFSTKGTKQDISTNQTTKSQPESLPITPYVVAMSQVGINEMYNDETIKRYHKAAKLKADGKTPWCASFMSWCFETAGYGGPRSAAAKDWLELGYETDEPKPGDICIFTRPGGNHVGFYVSEIESSIYLLSGNCDNEVKYKFYPKKNLIGIRTY